MIGYVVEKLLTAVLTALYLMAIIQCVVEVVK